MPSLNDMLCRAEGEVSPRLAPAITAAAQGLARLAVHLDAVAFREVWRAVAVALNRMLYNDVATEAAFSPQVHLRLVRPCHSCNTTLCSMAASAGQSPHSEREAGSMLRLVAGAASAGIRQEQALAPKNN